MTTVSDFGSLEIKQLRVQNDISAVRYGTEIYDRDLIFKVGDISNPNQSIRFSVHDGESYKDAFSVDSNGFAVSDLNMSGPSTGVIGVDELVKLGEMRVQHFNDHNNERAGEIVFSVNIGDTDVRTVDILSLSPEEVEITTSASIHGTLSCNSFATNTVGVDGNEFRPVIAEFNHPLGSNSVKIERDENGTVVLNGPLKSEQSYVNVLHNNMINSDNVVSSLCSVSSINVKHWSIHETGIDLSLTGHGSVRTSEIIVESMESDLVVVGYVESGTMSVSEMGVKNCSVVALSTSSLYFDSVMCGEDLSLPDVKTVTLGGLMIGEDEIKMGDCVISERVGSLGGLYCKSGNMSVSGIVCDDISSENLVTTNLSVGSILSTELSVNNVASNNIVVDKLKCELISTGGVVGVGNFEFTYDQNVISFSENGFESNLVISEMLSCSSLQSVLCKSSNISCSNIETYILESNTANVVNLVSKEIISEKCTVEGLETSKIYFNDLLMDVIDDSIRISSSLITPFLSTSSVNVDNVIFDDETSVRVSPEEGGLLVTSDLVCGGTIKSDASIHGIVSCGTVDCENINLKNCSFSTEKFSINTPSNSIVFDNEGLNLTGVLTLHNGRDELVLTDGHINYSDELTISCPILHLSDSNVKNLSVNSLITHQINSPTGILNVDCDVVCQDISVSKTLVSDSVFTSSISTQVINTLTVDFKEAQGVNTISGKGNDIVFRESEILLNSSDVSIKSDGMVSFGMFSQGAYFSIAEKNNKIEIASSDDVTFQNGVIVPQVSSKTVIVDTLRATETLTISSDILVPLHMSIGESCVVERSLVASSVSCSGMTTNSIENISEIQTNGLRIIEDGNDYMTLSRESIKIGLDSGDLDNARLAIRSSPFRDGISIKSDDKSTIRLQTKRNNKRGMVLVNETDSAEWMVGVGNYPLDKENTFGVHFNEESFLTMDPTNNTISIRKNTILTQSLSVESAFLNDLTMHECSISIQDEDQMTLSCNSLVVPGVLSMSSNEFLVTSPSVFQNQMNMSNNKIRNVAGPDVDSDAVNRGYVESRLSELFTEERVFTAPVYWAPSTNPALRSFAVGLSYTNPSNESSTDLSFEIMVGDTSNQSLRFVSSVNDAVSLVELFASQMMKVYCPVEIDGMITLPHATISSLVDALTIGGNVRSDGVGVGVAPLFPLHVVSTSDDDCAVLQSLSSRARTTIEAYGGAADQAMFTCKVDDTFFSSGYSKASDSFIIASSNDLSQNTHLVISRGTNEIQSAGDVRIVKAGGSFSIEELGGTVFFANKDTLRCETFEISFENFSVDHKLGNSSLLNLSSFGARISGSTEISNDLFVKNTTFSENDIGDMTVNKKMIIPDVETNTISLQNRQGFNLFEDDTDVVRFRENGSGMLLDFDSVSESLNFSFPTIPNTSGRGSFFVSDSPIFSLKKQAVNIDTTQEYAKLNVSTENGPQISILNPSNTPVHSDFTVDDSGELYITTTQRKYNFDGDVRGENMVIDDFMYFGSNKQWRMGISEDGSFVIQNNSSGVYVTKTEVSLG
jgi:hypothetical protein